MNNVLLISVNEIKNFTNINYNLSDNYITTTIQNVQQIYLQDIIGSALYNKLLQLVADTYNYQNGQETDVTKTLQYEGNADYQDFLDNYVKCFLCQKVESEILTIVNYQIRNKGVVKNDRSVDMNDINVLYRNKETSVNYWSSMISKYLSTSDFPELNDKNQLIKPKINRNYGNIQLWLGSYNEKC